MSGWSSVPEPLLVADAVTRRYAVSRRQAVHAVSEVSITVDAGETVGLVGESGCGKSTLGRVLLGLEPADRGRVTFAGEDLAGDGVKRVRRELQVVFQDPYSALNPRLTVGGAITEVLRVHRLCPRGEADARVRELFDRVGLRIDLARRRPFELSGGERQRAVIARALAAQPRLIVADEAVSALDVSIQAQILNLFGQLQGELGLAYVFISHDLSVVRHTSRRVFVMYLGRIVESGPTERLFERPRHPYTRGLMAAMPTLERRSADVTTKLSGDLPNPLDPPAGCAFHPRCPLATDLCRQEAPVLRELADGVAVACHHADVSVAQAA